MVKGGKWAKSWRIILTTDRLDMFFFFSFCFRNAYLFNLLFA